MRLTDDDRIAFFLLQTKIDILKGPVEEFIEAGMKNDLQRLLTLFPCVTQRNTLRISQQKVVFRAIRDPVEDWECALGVLQEASIPVIALWVFHLNASMFRVELWCDRRTIKASEMGWLKPTIDIIIKDTGKKKWAATCSAIPFLLFSFAIVTGYPIFKMRQIGMRISRRFRFFPTMASL